MSSRYPLALFGVLASILALVACGSKEPEAPLEPTLDAIQVRVFEPSCAMTGCHSALDSAGEVDLSTADASYASLVEVRATNAAARALQSMRVKPGDPERSFLRRKMDRPGADEGDAMPPGAPPLEAQHRAAIAEWIARGAKR